MCDPLTIGASVALLSVGSSVMQHIGTNQAYKANQLAANLSYANESDIIGQKAGQLDQEKSETAEDTAIAAAQAQGSIAASAADQGLGAASISQSLHASMFGIGRQQGIADLNDSNARAQLSNEKRGNSISRQSQIASKSRSSLAELGIGVGKGVMSGFQARDAAAKG